MQKIDPVLQRAVWARVRASLGRPARDCGALSRFLQNEQTGRSACRRLSRRLGGRGGALVLKIGAREDAHLRALQTLIFLETGCCPAFPVTPPDAAASELEELRAARERARANAGAYEGAAGDWPAYAALFQSMASDERTNEAWLERVMDQYS